jgi:hypothetical protein
MKMEENKDIEINIPICVSKKNYEQVIIPGAEAYGLSVEDFILQHVFTGIV